MTGIRLLGAGDEAALVRFLAEAPDHTMFLRSNFAEAGGFVDEGRFPQATYTAALRGEAIVAVAAVCWNGMLLVQAPEALADVVGAAARTAPRALTGLAGPWAHVVAARAALGMDARPTQLCSKEDLFSLDLADLRVPAELAGGQLGCRHPEEAELPLLAAWRRDYHVEALGDDPATAPLPTDEIARQHARGCVWVVTVAGRPAAMTMFNARTPDTVQVGGVYTPPAERGRHLARAAVAGSLLEARAGGATRAILFTGDYNTSAVRAYRALGFVLVGDYGLVLFAGR